MAKIPMGNFGNAMPQVERIRMPENQTGQMIAGALQNISQVAGKTAEAKDKQQQEAEVSAKRLELYSNQMAEQEAKVKLDDVLTTEMSEQVTLLKNDVSNGAMTAEAANQNLKTWSDARYKQLETEMPGHAQPNLKNYWSDNINRQTAGFLPLQLRADVQKGVVLADRYGEIATRMDRVKGREYLDSNLTTLNLSEADKQARIYGYEAGRDQLSIDDRITVALQGKDVASLQGLLTDLGGGKFGYLDGKQIQQNKDRVASRIDALNAQLKAEENKRVSEAGKFLNEYKSNVLTGRAQDTDYEANVSKLVAGTEHEQEFNFLKSQSANFQRFAGKSTSEQAALINEQKAKMKNSPSANAADEDRILSVYQSIYSEKLQTAKSNPNQTVREAGLKVNELGGLLLKTDTNSWIDGAIENGVSQLALKDANIALKPISAEDLPEAKKAFDAKSVDQKLNFIGGLISKSKGIKNGELIWRSALNQLGGEDRTYLLAGLAKSKNKSMNNENLADAIVNGQFLVQKGGFVLPSDLEATFRERYGNLRDYGSFSDDLKQFQYAYAVIANRNGISHAKKDDVSDVTTMNKAFNLATGGVYIQETGSWFSSFKTSEGGTLKSWKVPKPYGMTDDRFEAYLESGYENLSKQTGHTVSDLKGFRLAPRIDRNSNLIMYNLVNERNQKLTGKNGKEQFIIFNGVAR